MTIIEKNLTGKKSPQTCEDGIVVTHDFVAVIDGSTSKTPRQVCPGTSNGRLAMLLVSDHIKETAADVSLSGFCKGASKVLRDVSASNDYPLPEQLQPHERMAASVAVYSRYHRAVWMIGDCMAMVDGKLYENNKPAEAINAAKRSRIIKAAMAEGHPVEDFQTDDRGRSAILSDIIASMAGQNRDYAVIDGTTVAEDKVVTIPLSADEAHEIILATDGYPFLCTTLAESERRLTGQLSRDPLCIDTYQATKGLMKGNLSFDDRAYIRFQIPALTEKNHQIPATTSPAQS